jgi:O-antigen/teichoic acid export membrane protein
MQGREEGEGVFMTGWWRSGQWKALSSNSAWLFVSGLVVTVFGFLQTVLVARSLGVEAYGSIALVIVYVTVVNQIVDFRIHEAAVRYLSEYWVKGDRVRVASVARFCYLVDLSTGVAAFLIVGLTASWAARHLLHQPALSGWIVAYAFTLLFMTVNGTSRAILTVFDGFSWLSAQACGIAFAQLVLVVFFLKSGLGVTGVLTAYIGASLLGGVTLLFLARRRLGERLGADLGRASVFLLKDRWKEISQFLFQTNLNESLTLVTKNLDVLLLGYFRPVAEVGLYRMAKNFVGLLGLVSDPIYMALYPQLTKIWHGQREAELRRVLIGFTLLSSVAFLPFAVLFIVLCPVVIKAMIGNSFLPSMEAVRIMIWGGGFSLVFLWVRPVFLAAGKPGALTAINAVSAALMLALSLWVIPAFGFVGASWVYVFPIVVGHGLALVYFLTWKRWGVR